MVGVGVEVVLEAPNPAPLMGIEVGLVKATLTAMSAMVSCIILRYTTPLSACISSSSVSVIARYVYCNEEVINCINKLIILSNNGLCPQHTPWPP